ncbi:MAG: FkbM family methyltransferase, partial [Beijerinckiaceae bacterium]
MILRRMFAGKTDGFYVDVGAHHPFRFSNTCALYQSGWRGINIDADPALIAAFRRHRGRDINLSLGISDVPGTLAFHVFNEPA